MSYKKLLEEAREAMRIMASGEFCIFGCEIMKKEGCRSFTENSPINDKGICLKCKKKRYGWLSDDEKIIKNIIK